MTTTNNQQLFLETLEDRGGAISKLILSLIEDYWGDKDNQAVKISTSFSVSDNEISVTLAVNVIE